MPTYHNIHNYFGDGEGEGSEEDDRVIVHEVRGGIVGVEIRRSSHDRHGNYRREDTRVLYVDRVERPG